MKTSYVATAQENMKNHYLKLDKENPFSAEYKAHRNADYKNDDEKFDVVIMDTDFTQWALIAYENNDKK